MCLCLCVVFIWLVTEATSERGFLFVELSHCLGSSTDKDELADCYLLFLLNQLSWVKITVDFLLLTHSCFSSLKSRSSIDNNKFKPTWLLPRCSLPTNEHQQTDANYQQATSKLLFSLSVLLLVHSIVLAHCFCLNSFIQFIYWI